MVPLGVFHSAEEKPNSVSQENIEKSHYVMFRFNVLGQECDSEDIFCIVLSARSAVLLHFQGSNMLFLVSSGKRMMMLLDLQPGSTNGKILLSMRILQLLYYDVASPTTTIFSFATFLNGSLLLFTNIHRNV